MNKPDSWRRRKMKSFEEVLLSETNDIEFKEFLEISKPKSWMAKKFRK